MKWQRAAASQVSGKRLARCPFKVLRHLVQFVGYIRHIPTLLVDRIMVALGNVQSR
jgi:hypothetical protein